MSAQDVIDKANKFQEHGYGITRNGDAPTKNPDPLLSELRIRILLGENIKTNIFDRLNEKYPDSDFKKFILEDLTPETRELLTKNREKLKSELRNSTEITDKNGEVANDKLIKFLEEYYKCDKVERIKIIRKIRRLETIRKIPRLETIPEGDETNGDEANRIEGARAIKVDENRNLQL